ncbi:hypothetical protein DFH09DRAFT_1224186 [Mycena vulgaris]|nr:hypothetical protein DFH09DRAFT_1224186 [Mycena vulgaris]
MLIIATIGPLQHHALGLGFSFYGPQSVGCYAAAGALRAIDWFLCIPIIALISLVSMFLLYVATYMHILGVFHRNSTGNWSFFHTKSTPQDASHPSGSAWVGHATPARWRVPSGMFDVYILTPTLHQVPTRILRHEHPEHPRRASERHGHAALLVGPR